MSGSAAKQVLPVNGLLTIKIVRQKLERKIWIRQAAGSYDGLAVAVFRSLLILLYSRMCSWRFLM